MASLRCAKLVCTLGPACDSLDGLRGLITAGMDVARFNFSHGTHEEHGQRLARLRQASELEHKSVAALQDLCGPKVRTGRFARPFDLPTGADVILREGNASNDEPMCFFMTSSETCAASRVRCRTPAWVWPVSSS